MHQNSLLTVTKAQFVRHCHTPKTWPPNPANRAHDIEDVSQDKYDNTVKAISRDQSGRRTLGDGHDEVEHRKEVDNMMSGIKMCMKEVEHVMDNIDKSRKKEMDNLVKMVDDVQKEIAFQRSLDSDDEKRGNGFENATGNAETDDGEGDQHHENGRNDLMDEDNDDDFETRPDDLKHRLAALEIKVNVLKMDFNEFRSQANADSAVKSMEKLACLIEKLPRD